MESICTAPTLSVPVFKLVLIRMELVSIQQYYIIATYPSTCTGLLGSSCYDINKWFEDPSKINTKIIKKYTSGA